MLLSQALPIPIIAIVNLGLMYVWNLKVRNRAFKTPKIWIIAALGSLFNVWGLDVIQREFMIDTVPQMIRTSAGTWLVFVLATNAKYMAIYGWSKREFWLDYGGDWVGFLLAGFLVYVST